MSVSDDVGAGLGGGTLQLWRVNDFLYRPEHEVLQELEEHRWGMLANSRPISWGVVEGGSARGAAGPEGVTATLHQDAGLGSSPESAVQAQDAPFRRSLTPTCMLCCRESLISGAEPSSPKSAVRAQEAPVKAEAPAAASAGLPEGAGQQSLGAAGGHGPGLPAWLGQMSRIRKECLLGIAVLGCSLVLEGIQAVSKHQMLCYRPPHHGASHAVLGLHASKRGEPVPGRVPGQGKLYCSSRGSRLLTHLQAVTLHRPDAGQSVLLQLTASRP